MFQSNSNDRNVYGIENMCVKKKQTQSSYEYNITVTEVVLGFFSWGQGEYKDINRIDQMWIYIYDGLIQISEKATE